MVYNKKYDRWVSKDGLVYRYSKAQDKLIFCKQSKAGAGYYRIRVSCDKISVAFVHRLVWETFNGEIPDGYEIDHIDGNKQNNALSNLRCVTHTENMNNPLTLSNLRKPKSVFGRKFKEHYGITAFDDSKLHQRELRWFYRHGKCRWE